MNRKRISSTSSISSRRTGTTLVEVMVSCVLLAAFASAIMPATMRIARQRMVHRESLIAQHELMNQMERLSLLTDEELRQATVEISLTHDRLLPEARLQLQVHEQPDAPDRIELSLRWTNRFGVRSKSHVLVGWAASPAPASPTSPASPTTGPEEQEEEQVEEEEKKGEEESP